MRLEYRDHRIVLAAADLAAVELVPPKYLAPRQAGALKKFSGGLWRVGAGKAVRRHQDHRFSRRVDNGPPQMPPASDLELQWNTISINKTKSGPA
jgi:hypothetical protein